MLFLINFYLFIVFVSEYTLMQSICNLTIYESRFAPSTAWVPGIELEWSGVAVRTYTHFPGPSIVFLR